MRRVVILAVCVALAPLAGLASGDEIVKKVLAAAERAMTALRASSIKARPLWRADLGIACFGIVERMVKEDCAKSGASSDQANQACAQEWLREQPEFKVTLSGHSAVLAPYREGAMRMCDHLAEARMKELFGH
jgi:hypothetical protein